MATEEPATRYRDLQGERDLIEHAARGVVDPDRLIDHARCRSMSLSGEYVPHPMLVRTDVDAPRDVREELADAINRIVWWLQDHPDHPHAPRRLQSLKALVVEYVDAWSD